MSTTKADLLKLDFKRRAYGATMDLIKDEYDSYSAAKPGTEAQLVRLKDNVDNHNDWVSELFVDTLALCADAIERDTYKALFKPLMDVIIEYKDKLWTAMDSVQQAKAASAAAAAAKTIPAFKLAKIKLPSFTGNLSEWQSFHDLFVTSVHNNTTLTGAEKLIHLKTCLSRDPSAIVNSFAATDANYKSAWDLLLNRYNNKRELVFSHLHKLDTFKPMSSESASELRKLSDTINECLRSVAALGVTTDDWDVIVIYWGMKKLDTGTRKQWSLARTADLPKLKEFTEFLCSRAQALADSSLPTTKSSGKHTSSNHAAAGSSSKFTCVKCSEAHTLFKCPSFNGLSLSARKAFVHKQKLCTNCFRKGHKSDTCTSRFKCQTCGEKHNTLLHESSSASTAPPTPTPFPVTTPTPNVGNAHSVPEVQSHHVVLLGTILATATDSKGQEQLCRVFLDPGSEANFVSENFVDRLGLKRKTSCVTVTEIGGVAGEQSRGSVSVRLLSRTGQLTITVKALILRKLTGLLPRAPCHSCLCLLSPVQSC